MATRIYVIQGQGIAGPGVNRLVRAATRAQALRHVARDTFHVAIASQDALVRLLGDGAKVEDAAATDEEGQEGKS